MNRKYWKYILFCLVILFLLGELIGRFYGLCNLPLFIESKDYEYIYAPNQDLKIINNHFLTNEYSMRSKTIDLKKDTSVILLIGDSMINGGAHTSHDNLASSILEKQVSNHFNKNVRVLNISCGSWGPDNAAAFIKKHGTFNADLMILVVNSQDAKDHMTFDKKVGLSSKFPARNPSFAWTKIISSLFPESKKNKKELTETKILNLDYLNTGFDYFRNLSQKQHIPLLLYLHPTTGEISLTKLVKDKARIIQFCNDNDLTFIDESQLDIQKFHFRDHIHYNDAGQKFLANQLFKAIKEYPL